MKLAWTLLALGVIGVIVTTIVTTVRQTALGNPIRHDMGNGVICYTYDQGLACLKEN